MQHTSRHAATTPWDPRSTACPVSLVKICVCCGRELGNRGVQQYPKHLKQASSKQRCHDLVQVIVKLAAVKSINIWASGTWSSTTRSTTWNPWWAVIQGEMTFCCLARALMPPKTSRSSSIQRRLWVGWGLQAGCDPVGICILESCIWVSRFHFHSADTVIGWVAQEQGVNRGPLWCCVQGASAARSWYVGGAAGACRSYWLVSRSNGCAGRGRGRRWDQMRFGLDGFVGFGESFHTFWHLLKEG